MLCFRCCLFSIVIGLLSANQRIHAAELPDDLKLVKQQIIDITSANTKRTDNIREIRAQLDPLVAQLETWFIANRPENEVELTQVPWKNLWYDDPDISFDLNLIVLKIRQPRDRIFQVVEDGYYYNVSEFEFIFFGKKSVFQNYLKGAYSIIRPAAPDTPPAERLNTIALEFVYNGLARGPIPPIVDLSKLVQLVDHKLYPVVPVPGPIGVRGELWNSYVDDDLRISPGFNLDDPDTIDLYILQRVKSAN